MVHHKSQYYEYEYDDQKFEIDKISPLLEIKREKILQDIHVKFNKYIKSIIPAKYLEGKHSADQNIETMLSRFIFANLESPTVDPVIPYNPKNLDQLKKDINVKKSKMKGGSDIIEIFNDGVNQLREYYKSSTFENGDKKVTVKHQSVGKKQVELSIHNNTCIDKVVFSNALYAKLKDKYQGGFNADIHILMYCLVKRYQMLKSYNNQLAVHPDVLKKLRKNNNMNFELFGSALNVYSDNYCSLFYDIEKYFGSRGSFFKFVPIKGFYSMNPPFDELIMKNATCNMLNHMKKSSEKIKLIVWIPIWDKEGLQWVKEKCNNKVFISNADYGEFEAMVHLKKSPYLKIHKRICLQKMPYFDYVKGIKKYAANTNVLVLEN